MGVLLFGAFLLTGCAPSVSVARLNTAPEGHKVPSESVEVYTDRANVPRPYVEIALISLDDLGWDNISDADLIKAIVEKAKGVGADGVIILGRTTASGGGTFVGTTYVADTKRMYQAVAFVYK